MQRWSALAGLVVAASVAVAMSRPIAQDKKQDRDALVRTDKDKVGGEGFWIYDDLPRGIAQAKSSGKPLLVVFRCIPCEACAKLDEQVVERDPTVQALLDKFVCVRIPHANGMDLALFQYDYDQSWAAFFLNADLTIYGRYGTRSHRTESERDVSLEGFAKALEGALELHAQYPANKAALAAKRGAPPDAKVPEDYPTFKGRFTAALDYKGAVAKSCIHCHQLGEAQRLVWRNAGKPIPTVLMHPYPNPKILGLVMDPKQRARVLAVTASSQAESDGFKVGDDIATFDGQPVLSIADMQWVLQHAGETGSIAAGVVRDGKPLALTLTLAAGWRLRDDISWRATSWDLRRMVTGGLTLEDLASDARKAAKLGDAALALRVTNVGQFGDHAVAKNAGFQKDDLIVALDGKTERLTESEWMAALIARTKPGDVVSVKVRRGASELDLKLPMQ
jgi:hypothetical protein